LGQCASIILAAGKGTRMKSRLSKVLHKVCGKPMLEHVIQAAREAGVKRNNIVIGHGAEEVKEEIGSGVEWIYQMEQLGTGHAVMQAEPLLADFQGSILILCGDTPLITAQTLTHLIDTHEKSGCAVTVLTALMDDPAGYGRIVRGGGRVQEIVEHKDASEEQLKINEINTGMYCFDSRKLFAGLKKTSPANAQGEYYLTDVLSVLRKSGEAIGAVTAADAGETMGINNRIQLAGAEKTMRENILKKLMMEGVTIIDPNTTYVDREVIIGVDSIIYPGTIIQGKCRLGENCQIGPYSRLKDVQTGSGVVIQNSVVLESETGNDVTIGPFAYIRPGTVMGNSVKVGDFVEIKKSVIGHGSKIPHLSYVGDAEIGEKVNIGAGTITCNYDGQKKSRTVIGDNSFIGSNTNLVAPVTVGSEAVIGAGSTITKNVPEGALCVERSKQEVYPNWNSRKNKKK
jgi:bifunctional UDP-N-acetylglucosamine pyrophosphorylase/glucosamine-1-phosphate N-acetyltransferase